MASKLIITADYKTNEWVLKLKTDNKRKKIGGHRFTDLLGFSQYAHPISILMSAFGLWDIDDNEFMKAGRDWETRIIEAVANDGFQTFSYEEYKGNCFDNPFFGGLMDAYDPVTKIVWEAKLYFFKLKDEKKAGWFQQLALYWKLWSDMHPGEKIDAGIAYLRNPKSEESFSNNDVIAEQLPESFKKDIEKNMLKALYAYEKLTKKDKDGVMTARSKMTPKITEEINWMKNKYKDLIVEAF